MRQLTSLDAQFLALENPRQSGHVAGLAILDPSTAQGGRIGCREITELLRERLPLLPPLRWRLGEGPLGLGYPYWVGGGLRCRWASTTRTGWTTATSTSATTCASSRWPRRAATASWPSRWPGSPPARWTARARCGRSTSSRGWRAVASRS